MNNWS